MASFRSFNLAGTYEFFSLDDARRAADEGRLRPGTVVIVDGRCYLAMYYDAEKRIVLVDGPRCSPAGPACERHSLPMSQAYLLASDRRSKRKSKR